MSETNSKESTQPSAEILFDISASAARIAASCRADCDIRFYLKGIKVEPNPDGGVFVIGSNGHVLGVCSDASGKASAAVIVSITKYLGEALPKRSTLEPDRQRLRLVRFCETLQLHLTDASGKVDKIFVCSVLDGNFPNWRAFMPDFSILSPMSSPVYLPYLAIATKGVKCDLNYAQAQFYQANPDGAIAAFLPDHPDTLFVVMPQHPNDKDGKAFAAWRALWTTQREIGVKWKTEANKAAESGGASIVAETADAAPQETAGA